MRRMNTLRMTQTGRPRTAAARADVSAGTTRPNSPDAAPMLECGHPGLPSNLKNGRCGTCQCADEFEQLSKTTIAPALKTLMAKLAAQFRSGAVVYDTGGQTLLEMTEAARSPSISRFSRA